MAWMRSPKTLIKITSKRKELVHGKPTSRIVELCADILQAHFASPISEVADKLRVSLTALKW
jgi:hypothetical protein